MDINLERDREVRTCAGGSSTPSAGSQLAPMTDDWLRHRRGTNASQGPRHRCSADRRQNHDSWVQQPVDPLAAAGMPIWIDRDARVAHAKTMVIDGASTLMGWMHWTCGAAANADGLNLSCHQQSWQPTRRTGDSASPCPCPSIAARTCAGSGRVQIDDDWQTAGASSGTWPTISIIT